MKANRNLALGLVAAGCLALAWWLVSRPSTPPPASAARPAGAAAARGARRSPGSGELPEIGLARVLERDKVAVAGKRDIFAFGPPPTQAPPPPLTPIRHSPHQYRQAIASVSRARDRAAFRPSSR